MKVSEKRTGVCGVEGEVDVEEEIGNGAEGLDCMMWRIERVEEEEEILEEM